MSLHDLTMAGGGVRLGAGSLSLTNCNIRDTIDSAIRAETGTRLTVTSSSIVDCGFDYAFGGNPLGGAYDGGAIYSPDGTVVIRDSVLAGNLVYQSGGALFVGGSLEITNSAIVGNGTHGYGSGGGLLLTHGTATITRSLISGNDARYYGGGISASGTVTVAESTISDNYVTSFGLRQAALGGGIFSDGNLIIRNSTITGNRAIGDRNEDPAYGGGISVVGLYGDAGQLDIANSIVAGNSVSGSAGTEGPDLFGTITRTNGHNVFGSDVAGNNVGDRENVAASAIFAAIDPDTGNGVLGPDRTVVLRSSLANPALAAADPLAGLPSDQVGTARPLPSGSLADWGRPN